MSDEYIDIIIICTPNSSIDLANVFEPFSNETAISSRIVLAFIDVFSGTGFFEYTVTMTKPPV